MPKQWTLDYLEALSVHDRHNLFKNAVRLSHTEEGSALKAMIEEAGLPFSEGAMLSSEDPAYLKMYDIVHSPEGRASAISAVNNGLPGLAGVEPMIVEALGVD